MMGGLMWMTLRSSTGSSTTGSGIISTAAGAISTGVSSMGAAGVSALGAGAEILLIGGRKDFVRRSPSASSLRTFLTFGSMSESVSVGGFGGTAAGAGLADSAGFAER